MSISLLRRVQYKIFSCGYSALKKQRSKAACQRVIKRFDTFKNYRVNSLPAYFADVIKLLKIKSY